MGELEQEYGNRVDFRVMRPEETAAASADIEAFGFTELRHGLVAFSPEGEALVKLAGHSFGRDGIAAAAETVLAAD